MTHAILFAPVESAAKYGFPRWDITAQDGDTLVSIARVLPVGSKAERQATAEKLVLRWNTHDEMLAALEAFPIRRLNETPIRYINRIIDWHQDLQSPAIAKARGKS